MRKAPRGQISFSWSRTRQGYIPERPSDKADVDPTPVPEPEPAPAPAPAPAPSNGQAFRLTAHRHSKRKPSRSKSGRPASPQRRRIESSKPQSKGRTAAHRDGDRREPKLAAKPKLVAEGGRDKVICDIITGAYHIHGENHGKKVWRRDAMAGENEVLIFYWDDRDGADLAGWWVAPTIGGEQVWAFNATGAKEAMPPTASWHLPHDGPIDPSFHLRRTGLGSHSTKAAKSRRKEPSGDEDESSEVASEELLQNPSAEAAPATAAVEVDEESSEESEEEEDQEERSEPKGGEVVAADDEQEVSSSSEAEDLQGALAAALSSSMQDTAKDPPQTEVQEKINAMEESVEEDLRQMEMLQRSIAERKQLEKALNDKYKSGRNGDSEPKEKSAPKFAAAVQQHKEKLLARVAAMGKKR